MKNNEVEYKRNLQLQCNTEQMIRLPHVSGEVEQHRQSSRPVHEETAVRGASRAGEPEAAKGKGSFKGALMKPQKQKSGWPEGGSMLKRHRLTFRSSRPPSAMLRASAELWR